MIKTIFTILVLVYLWFMFKPQIHLIKRGTHYHMNISVIIKNERKTIALW